jgi:hypothetical protein
MLLYSSGRCEKPIRCLDNINQAKVVDCLRSWKVKVGTNYYQLLFDEPIPNNTLSSLGGLKKLTLRLERFNKLPDRGTRTFWMLTPEDRDRELISRKDLTHCAISGLYLSDVHSFASDCTYTHNLGHLGFSCTGRTLFSRTS